MTDQQQAASVKRYTFTMPASTMAPSRIEQFVRESDYDRAIAERDAAQRECERLKEEADGLAWIRRKLNLPPDAKMFSGQPNVAGTMHVMCADAHGMQTYIRAYKCDDKQAVIARLTVDLDKANEAIRKMGAAWDAALAAARDAAWDAAWAAARDAAWAAASAALKPATERLQHSAVKLVERMAAIKEPDHAQ